MDGFTAHDEVTTQILNLYYLSICIHDDFLLLELSMSLFPLSRRLGSKRTAFTVAHALRHSHLRHSHVVLNGYDIVFAYT